MLFSLAIPAALSLALASSEGGGDGAADTAPFAWRAASPLGNIEATFTSAGLEVKASGDETSCEALRLRLARWGRGTSIAEVEEGSAVITGRRLDVQRGSLTEWYLDEARGVEQGFTIDQPPVASAHDAGQPVALVLDLGDDGAAEVLPGERDARLLVGGGSGVFLYTGLRAWDAWGCELPARFVAENGGIRILVDDRGAAYPLTVDPWLWIEEPELIGCNVGTSHNMGWAVSLDGDTALVSATGDNHAGVNAGAVYVYVRSGTTWAEQAWLTSSDANAVDYFGTSVSLSGDTALIGSWGANGAVANTGAAYVFVRSGTTWTQQAKLIASDGASSDEFGGSVSLVGNTALIGSRFHDHTGSLDDAGAAYVFVRSGTVWTEQNELAASDAARDAEFGFSLSLTGTRALVGAPFSTPAGGAAYVFVYLGTSWFEEAKLASSDLSLQDYFGGTVHLSGNTAVVGASNHSHAGLPPNGGSAYVFAKTGSAWIEQAELISSDLGAFDAFGSAIAVADDTAVVGAFRHSAIGTYSGAAYVFTREGTTWSQQSKIVPSGLAGGDQFGCSVAYEDELALIGAHGDDGLASNGGTALSFVRSAQATATFRNDAGQVNPTGYTAAAPVIGANWAASVDNTATSNSLAWIVGYADPLEVFVPQASEFLLVDPMSPGGEVLQLSFTAGSGIVNFNVSVPPDPSLCGETLATQGAGFGGVDGVTLHNAYDLFVGH